MTVLDAAPRLERVARPRRFLMCRPEHFDVTYAINPWMDPSRPVDRQLALRQWDALKAAYERLGHRVEVLPGVHGLPDMVFAANGALVVGGRALGARFTHPQRTAEAPAHAAWLRAAGIEVVAPEHVNEGEGDFVVVGDLVLAGTGFRTDPGAHGEAARVLGVEVVSLALVDPRYYHLDTCLAALGNDNIAYYPGAFSAEALEVLERRFPDAVLASEHDASVLGLNLVCDGRHVVICPEAVELTDRLAEAGYVPVPVDLSELLKAGGGVKCCTLELRA
ncbi:MAG: amidinotransferase [Frankiales bacterium]|nr:amidinotransferase [Frankiales bacterium]